MSLRSLFVRATVGSRSAGLLRVGLPVVVAGAAWLGWRPAGAAEPAPPRPFDARQTWLSDCAVCHGSDGRGTSRGPTLAGVGRSSVDYWLTTGRMPLIAEAGRGALPQGGRPATATQLGDPTAADKRHVPSYSPDEIAKLEDYVASLGGGGPDVPVLAGTASVASGGEVFRLQCAACHAWAGDGGALLHVEAPNLHRSTPKQVAEAIRVGPGSMPAFGTAALSDQQLADVVAYVRYIDAPDDRGGQGLWHLGPVAEGAIALLGAMGVLLLVTRWIGERG